MEYDGLNGIWVELGNDWIGYGGLGVIWAGLDVGQIQIQTGLCDLC